MNEFFLKLTDPLQAMLKSCHMCFINGFRVNICIDLVFKLIKFSFLLN